VAVDVFDGDLGLADAAHAVQGLDDRAVAGQQRVADGAQEVFPAGEAWVPGGDVAPDGVSRLRRRRRGEVDVNVSGGDVGVPAGCYLVRVVAGHRVTRRGG
jgi:hypothetical protein